MKPANDDRVKPGNDEHFSWSDSLLHRAWSAGRGALNQHLFKVTSTRYPKWFLFYWLNSHMPSYQAIAASKTTTIDIESRPLANLCDLLLPKLMSGEIRVKDAGKIVGEAV